MTLSSLYRALRDKIPAEKACDWDNDGIMCLPNPERTAGKLLLVLDITDETVEHAIRCRYDAIISHHPLIFRGLKHLTPDDIVARRCIALCRHDIAAFSFHTALDATDGVNDRLAAQLGLKHIRPYSTERDPIGRMGSLSAPMPACAFAALVARALHCDAVTVGDPDRPALHVAVIGGSGKDDIPAAIAAGADTMVTGECGYHEMLDAAAMGMDVITAGHFYTEQNTLLTLREILLAADPAITVDIFNTNRMKTVISPQQ